MKVSENWLREWVDPPVSTEELVRQLTNAGLEVDSVEPVAGDIGDVVIAEVIEAGPHPDADRLTVCEVNAGEDDRFTVVCGAPNARAGMRSAFAAVGARIADGTKIRKSKIRGVTSQGMLCSARELGLGDAHEGILELPEDAPVGAALASYLGLDDVAIDIDLTPNRGECLGVAGVAREIGAINQCSVTPPQIPLVKRVINEKLPVELEAPADCPRYVGRIIRGIDPNAATPLWMQEKLRRSGVRCISPVVDVTNYVMLELGQPMHAFDFQKLDGGIRVRRAQEGETLVLLDEREVTLTSSTLVIADEKRAVALAGIMGGLDSAVTGDTRDIFLESAFFSPLNLIGQARSYGLHTDASHRFERGVDPELQRRAAERATGLLLDIVGGEPGPIVDEVSAANMPRRSPIKLRLARVERLLGMEIDPAVVSDVLGRLGMFVEAAGEGWEVTPPSYRFDVSMEADLIEEVARLVGYNELPSIGLGTMGKAPTTPEAGVPPESIRDALIDRGYHEAVTYSFVDPELQAALDPESVPIPLANPISSEMSVMRTNLWPGLVRALVHNTNRQQARVRLFELGLTFKRDGGGEQIRGFDQVGGINQVKCLAGVTYGSALPEQWGEQTRDVDFFDAKSDIERVLALTRRAGDYRFVPASHPALHPGQTARIELAEGPAIGWLGALHPALERQYKLSSSPFLFQLALAPISQSAIPSYRAISRYPAVRRDLALIVDETIAADTLRDLVGQASPDMLKNLEFFDLYRGEGIDSGKKSVAIGLTFQAASRTLHDDEIDGFVDRIVARLEADLGASLRGS